jgi:hypothetical protein
MAVCWAQELHRDRAIASVEKRIGEVEAYLAACDGVEGQGSAAAARRFLHELKQMLAMQRGSSKTGNNNVRPTFGMAAEA